MIAIDTNVLVRILVDDEKQKRQNVAARRLAERAKKVFIPQLVQVEAVWVFKSAHRLTRQHIIFLLDHLLENSAFVLQYEADFTKALQLYKEDNVEFADCVVLVTSVAAQLKLATFDRKLAKLAHVQLVSSLL